MREVCIYQPGWWYDYEPIFAGIGITITGLVVLASFAIAIGLAVSMTGRK